MNWLSQMRARSEEEISKLSERVQYLQKLYESQELIISKSNNFYQLPLTINANAATVKKT